MRRFRKGGPIPPGLTLEEVPFREAMLVLYNAKTFDDLPEKVQKIVLENEASQQQARNNPTPAAAASRPTDEDSLSGNTSPGSFDINQENTLALATFSLLPDVETRPAVWNPRGIPTKNILKKAQPPRTTGPVTPPRQALFSQPVNQPGTHKRRTSTEERAIREQNPARRPFRLGN